MHISFRASLPCWRAHVEISRATGARARLSLSVSRFIGLAMPKRGLTPSCGDRVLDAAIDQFGRHGICGASTRAIAARSEEHTSELQSLMRISYAVFCLKNK